MLANPIVDIIAVLVIAAIVLVLWARRQRARPAAADSASV